MQNKYLKYLLLLIVVAFIVPHVALAAWWNPLSWNILNWLHPSIVQPAKLQVNTNSSSSISSRTTVQQPKQPVPTNTNQINGQPTTAIVNCGTVDNSVVVNEALTAVNPDGTFNAKYQSDISQITIEQDKASTCLGQNFMNGCNDAEAISKTNNLVGKDEIKKTSGGDCSITIANSQTGQYISCPASKITVWPLTVAEKAAFSKDPGNSFSAIEQKVLIPQLRPGATGCTENESTGFNTQTLQNIQSVSDNLMTPQEISSDSNIIACNSQTNSQEKDICLMNAAVKENSSSICQLMANNQQDENACWINLAASEKNVSLCAKIVNDDNSKNTCQVLVQIK